MVTDMDVDGLEARREAIRRELASIGDLRPGSLFERYRKCGKPTCHCVREGDPGHGPSWVLTSRVGGRALTRAIPPEAVARTRAQVEECRRLRALTAELVEVSEGLLNDLKAFDAAFDGAPTCRTLDKGHGRIDERECALVALDGCAPGTAPLPGRRQAFRITRRRTVVKSGRTGGETACGLTSLPPERAGPAEALALNRGHWEIETHLHCVRDVACDEDRSRIRCGRLPRNLACLSNAAISIVHLRGRFNGQPQAHRHAAQKHPNDEPEAARRPRRPHPRPAGKTQGHRPSSPGRQQGDFEMAFAEPAHPLQMVAICGYAEPLVSRR